MATDSYPPPKHLSTESQELWRRVVPVTGWSAGRLELLGVALSARDRSRQASALLRDEGLVAEKDDAKMPHAHPAVKIERDAWSLFVRIWSQLGLESTYRDFNPPRNG